MERLSAARPLLLASGSPRRREILENLRVPFVVRPASADESTKPRESPAEYLERVALAKLASAASMVASTAASRGEGDASFDVVLVADTSVIDVAASGSAAILGKPGSLEEAESMIARLAGRTHEVWTRFLIGSLKDEGAHAERPRVLHAETVVTRVTFRALTPERVRAYAASGEGTDKAGAYAVQGLGAGLVARIEGSYSNVVGLPACEVAVALEELGLLP